MKKPLFIYGVLWLSLGLNVLCLAKTVAIPFEDNSLHFFSLTQKDGLPFKPVTVMYQDQTGYMWLGSQWGLCRYNGYEFKVFSDLSITAIQEDEQHNVWVGTTTGLLCIDRFREEQTVYQSSIPGIDFDAANFIHCLEFDRNGTVWLGTKAGLFRFLPHTDEYKHDPYIPPVAATPSTAYLHDILCIAVDDAGMIWLGMEGGLVELNPKTETFTPYNFVHNLYFEQDAKLSRIHQLIRTKSNTLWLRGFLSGLVSFDPETKHFQNFKSIKPSLQNEYMQPDVSALMEAQDGIVWIGSDTGLYRFHPSSQEFVFDYEPGRRGGLDHPNIQALFQDRNDAIWISTDNGLNVYDPFLHQFRALQHHPDNANSLIATEVYSICEDNDGNIWIGTLYGGLNCFDPQTQLFTYYQHDPDQPNTISGDTVTALDSDQHGNIWVGTWQNGLCVLNPSTGKVKRYPYLDTESIIADDQALNFKIVRTIQAAADGKIWVGTEKGGVSVLNPNTDTFVHYRANEADQQSLSLNAIRSMYQDHEGALWIGTGGYWMGGKGLNRFLPETHSFQRYLNFPPALVEPFFIWINGITEDQRHRLWLASDFGLFQMIDRQDEYQWFTPQNGLLDNQIRSVLCSDDGYIWVSTANTGLTRIHPDTHEITNYDESYGIVDTRFNHNAAVKAKDGTLYFGGMGGVTYLKDGILYSNPQKPKVIIEQIEVQDEPFSMAAAQSQNQLALSYWQNSMTFQFTALQYTHPMQSRYHYRMKGLDDNWVDSGAVRTARYNHLPPDSYEFQVEAVNSFGVWSETTSLPIIIPAPFWETWWFVLTSVAAIIGLGFGSVKWRISHIQAINSFLECQVKTRTQQLQIEHDHAKSIIQSSPGLIAGIEPNGLITFLNPVAEELFGVVEMDAKGKPWWDLVPNEPDRNKLREVHKKLASGEVHSYEFPVMFHTGLARNMVWRCINQYNEVQTVTESIIFGNDITEQIQKEIIEISSREQQNIGREIHDSLCQSLTGVGYMCESLTKRREFMTEEDAGVILKIRHYIKDITDQSRRLAKGLYLHELEQNNLEKALHELTSTVQSLYSIPCLFHVKQPVQVDSFNTATHLYRIVQEALNNAAKYSRASCIEIIADGDEQQSTIWIKDDGVGFDMEQQPRPGMGLEIMRFRARMIQAKLEMRSQPGQGTEILCTYTNSQSNREIHHE